MDIDSARTQAMRKLFVHSWPSCFALHVGLSNSYRKISCITAFNIQNTSGVLPG